MKTETDETAVKCCFCGSKPKIIHYEDNLWYVECPNKECDKHPRYAYMGFRKPAAIEQWNWANRPIQRKVVKKGEKDEDGDI